jgi:hypothetical protein
VGHGCASIKRALSDYLVTEAPEGRERVFPEVDGESNLRTTLLKIIARAGVKPWPKLWQNLRASAATDWARSRAEHVATEFCGHTKQVAIENYRMVTDHDYEAALTGVDEFNTLDELLQKASQNTAHFEGETSQNTAQYNELEQGQSKAESLVFAGSNASLANDFIDKKVGEEGFEPPTSTL